LYDWIGNSENLKLLGGKDDKALVNVKITVPIEVYEMLCRLSNSSRFTCLSDMVTFIINDVLKKSVVDGKKEV